jgi:hypothetical protein
MSTDDDTRDFARALFDDTPPEDEAPPPDPKPGNHVPREGNNPRPPADTDMREYVRNLFHATD